MMHDMPDLQCLNAGITPGCYNHPFRQDIKNFTKGVKVTNPAPRMMNGAEVHA